MEWKEGQADVARSLYKRAADIDSVSPNAARVFQVGRCGEGKSSAGKKGKDGELATEWEDVRVGRRGW